MFLHLFFNVFFFLKTILASIIVVTHTVHSLAGFILTINVLPSMLQFLNMHKIVELVYNLLKVRENVLSQPPISRSLSMSDGHTL